MPLPRPLQGPIPHAARRAIRRVARAVGGAWIVAAMLSAGCENTSPVEHPRPGEFEFIVVGSGAGGGPLAARLARAGRRVLLVEAGSDVGGRLEYQVPAMHALSTETPDMAWWYFVQHHADAAIDESDTKYTPEGILYPRGSALGGSTAVNAMVTVLPPPSDWDRLATLTDDAGFRASGMDPYIDRVKEWLPTTLADPTLAAGDRPVADMIVAAASVAADEDDVAFAVDPTTLVGTAAELGRLLDADMNNTLRYGETTGVFRLPQATQDGERHGTREFILDTVEQGFPLTVWTETFCTKVLWDENADAPTAIGIEYVGGRNVYQASLGTPDAPSVPQRIYTANRQGEVILAAGAFNSPQILKLSGVGPRAELEALDIPVRLDAPGVGGNLQDRIEVSVVTEVNDELTLLAECHLEAVDEDDPCLQDWAAQKDGAYATNGFLASTLMRSGPDVALSDLQIFATPSEGLGYFPGYSSAAIADNRHFSWLILKAHTQNRDGTVTLRSDDPFERPDIQFNSLDETDPLSDPDLLAVVAGVRRVRDIIDRANVRSDDADMFTEVVPGPALESDEDIAAWARKEAWGHHACCTNPMGSAQSGAVLDASFRVRGAQNLRVVDASVFPEIPGTFIALPIFMISERAADIILEQTAP